MGSFKKTKNRKNEKKLVLFLALSSVLLVT